MKLLRIIVALTLLSMLVCGGRSQTIIPASSPPSAPAGYRWQPVRGLSDEFEGARLDASKWQASHPYWTGRPPQPIQHQ